MRRDGRQRGKALSRPSGELAPVRSAAIQIFAASAEVIDHRPCLSQSTECPTFMAHTEMRRAELKSSRAVAQKTGLWRLGRAVFRRLTRNPAARSSSPRQLCTEGAQQ